MGLRVLSRARERQDVPRAMLEGITPRLRATTTRFASVASFAGSLAGFLYNPRGINRGEMMANQFFIAVSAAPTWTLPTVTRCIPAARGKRSLARGKFDSRRARGTGANQAVCSASLRSERGAMVAKIGSYLFGPRTIKHFEAQGIDAIRAHRRGGVFQRGRSNFVTAGTIDNA